MELRSERLDAKDKRVSVQTTDRKRLKPETKLQFRDGNLAGFGH